MPRIPLLMPQLGESIAEATVVNIGIKVGDTVQGDQDIMEVETNKAVLNVSAPAPGRILELNVEPQGTYPVGAVLGYLEVTAADIARLGLTAPADTASAHRVESQQGADGTTVEMPETEPGVASGSDDDADRPHFGPDETNTGGDIFPISQTGSANRGENGEGAGLPVPARVAGGAGWFSPRVQARMRELGLQPGDLAGVAGTGTGGRPTVADVEKFLAGIEAHAPRPASAMRLAIADAMRRSWTRPLATVGRPIVLDALFAHRATCAEPKPGLALYALRALALALAETRGAAVTRLIGGKLVPPAALDIGFAVEATEGIVVPVLRAADKSPLRELTGRYVELLALAQARRLTPDDTEGAVASVTNYGPFGLTWGTPIPLPDQALILGIGALQKAPRWDEATAAFLPVTQAEFTLTIDHRSLDGGGAGRLLARIAELLAKPAEL